MSLKKRIAELKNINESLDDFVHAAAHDLRSPVTNLQLLVNNFDDIREETKDFTFSNIKQSVEKLDLILKGLVQIIEIISDKQQFFVNISFDAAFKKIQDEMNEDLQKINGRIFIDFEKAPFVKYDESFLKRIFRILLDNAIKYHSPSRLLEVHVSTEKIPGYTIIKIQDNGIGFDIEKHKKNLFKPFARFSQSQTGLGLGLHLVKSMVVKDGGKIVFDSVTDKFTTVTCYLKK